MSLKLSGNRIQSSETPQRGPEFKKPQKSQISHNRNNNQKRVEGVKLNLDFLLNPLGFGTFSEIGDKSEPSPGVLDQPDGGSPSLQGFGGGILVL